MNIIYRVYRKHGYYSYNEIIDQNVMEVNSKEDFKTAIKILYGEDIKFKNNKNIKDGDLFISIISYNAYEPDNYLLATKMKCDYCNKEFIAPKKQNYKFQEPQLNTLQNLNQEYYEQINKELASKTFCSSKCTHESFEEYRKIFRAKALEADGFVDEWVSRENYNDNSGYIYIITKKDTGEFYVGKTNALPMFRWVQHLKTDRFPIENITNYTFEILEVCEHNMSERELFWIKKKYLENNDKCLNKYITKI